MYLINIRSCLVFRSEWGRKEVEVKKPNHRSKLSSRNRRLLNHLICQNSYQEQQMLIKKSLTKNGRKTFWGEGVGVASTSVPLACSRCSDSGARAENMVSVFCSLYSSLALHYLNVWNRLLFPCLHGVEVPLSAIVYIHLTPNNLNPR